MLTIYSASLEEADQFGTKENGTNVIDLTKGVLAPREESYFHQLRISQKENKKRWVLTCTKYHTLVFSHPDRLIRKQAAEAFHSFAMTLEEVGPVNLYPERCPLCGEELIEKVLEKGLELACGDFNCPWSVDFTPPTQKRVGITGHRPKDLPGGYNRASEANRALYRWLQEKVRELSPDRCCSGMALGVDQWFASSCVQLNIPFEAFLPCRGQESRWPDFSKESYHRLLSQASKVRYTTEGPYTQGCMQQRNQDMVTWLTETGGILLAVWSGKKSGTSNTVKKALAAGIRVISFHPETLEERELTLPQQLDLPLP